LSAPSAFVSSPGIGLPRPTADGDIPTSAGISHVDWPAFRNRGYNAVVIDKDNCLVSCIALDLASLPAKSKPPRTPRLRRTKTSCILQ
jgi:hypothetical protein